MTNKAAIEASCPAVRAYSEVQGVLDAMDKAAPKERRALSPELNTAWSKLHRAIPTSREGAAILIRDAGDYEDDLHDPALPFSISPLPGQVALLAKRVEAGAYTAQEVGRVADLAKATRMTLGAKHPMPRMLGNAATYLRGM